MAGNAATVVMYTTAKKLQKFAQHVIIHRLTSKEELKKSFDTKSTVRLHRSDREATI